MLESRLLSKLLGVPSFGLLYMGKLGAYLQALQGLPRTRPSGRCSISAPQEVVPVLRLS
jgi:hypothetical protein